MHPRAGLDPLGRPSPFCGSSGQVGGGQRSLPTAAGPRVTELGLPWARPVGSTQVPSSLLFVSRGPRGWASPEHAVLCSIGTELCNPVAACGVWDSERVGFCGVRPG